MTKDDFFVDIHCHPNIKAFNSGHPIPQKTMWENISGEDATGKKGLFASFVYNNTQDLHKESQSNFYSLARANVKVAFVSLYPIEKGFFTPRNLPTLFTSKRNLAQVYVTLFGSHYDRVLHLLNSKPKYFEDLNAEYDFVRNGQGSSPDGRFSYKIVNNHQEIEDLRREDPNAIAVVLTIEGAHSLGAGQPDTANMSYNELSAKLLENITAMKSWEHVPFNLNLAHHFWNQLTGHAKSMKGVMTALLNQNEGLNLPIQKVGQDVIEGLLSNTNGRRILIDTKHMSPTARKEYFEYVSNYNRTHHDNIPIICSHTGVNGFETIDESTVQGDTMRKLKNSYFNNWSINISNEEIRMIHESKGLIGIMFDKVIMAGLKLNKLARATKDLKRRKDLYTRLLLDNILQVVEACGERSAWDRIAIGSDFDGAISHIDHLYNAEQLSVLHRDMVNYLERKEYRSDLWYDYSPQELVSKVMRTNAMEFLKKNFNQPAKEKTEERVA